MAEVERIREVEAVRAVGGDVMAVCAPAAAHAAMDEDVKSNRYYRQLSKTRGNRGKALRQKEIHARKQARL